MLILRKKILLSLLMLLSISAMLEAQDAQLISLDIPDTVITDEVFKVEIEMKNTGAITWGAGNGETGASLVSKFPNFNTTWGTYFITMHQGNSIAPGETYFFESYLMAPHQSGIYNFDWQCQNWLPEGGDVDTTTNFFGEIITGLSIVVNQRQETPPTSPTKEPAMLDSSDFEYLGSFKLPSLPGYEQTYTNSGLALKNAGDEKHLLIMTGTYDFALYEAEIPELIKPENGNISSLNTASVVTDWGPLDFGKIGGENIKPNSGFWYDNDENILYWTHYNSYFTGGSSDFPIVMTTRLNNDGTKTNLNNWYLPGNLDIFKSYWGGIIKLSDNFAQTYTGGKKFALGFGGYFSICGTASRGPGLAAISKPDPADSIMDITSMMKYPDPVACPRPGNYFSNIGYWQTQPTAPWKGWWTGQDVCRAGVFIDLPDKKGYMVFARLGIGRLGYDFGGYNADGKYQQYWYFYSIDDLGNAAAGNTNPTSITPVSYYAIDYPVEGGVISGACFDEETRNLYLYSHKPVIHVFHLKESAVYVNNNANKIEGFSLVQNYPNPFNPTTTIKYSIADGALSAGPMVTLKVYTLLGQEVAVLVNKQQAPGTHTVQWNGKNASGHKVGSGVYFYQLTTGGGFTDTKKMIILK